MIVSAFYAQLSIIQARHYINAALSLDPSYFPYATAVISLLFSPFIWLILATVILSIFILIQSFVMLIKTLQINIFGHKSIIEFDYQHTGRLIGAIAFLFISSCLVNKQQEYHETLVTITKYGILAIEYFPNGPCSNVKKDQPIAFLGNERISVITLKDKGIYTTEIKIYKY